jgi:hypothetical protein
LGALALDPRMRPGSVREFALALASAVPPAGDHPGGLAIVRTVARELTQSRSQQMSVRSSQPTEIARPAPADLVNNDCGAWPRIVPPDRTTVKQRLSTLAGAASQSLAPATTRPRWPIIAGGASAALIIGAATAFAIGRLIASDPGTSSVPAPAGKVQDVEVRPAGPLPASHGTAVHGVAGDIAAGTERPEPAAGRPATIAVASSPAVAPSPSVAPPVSPPSARPVAASGEARPSPPPPVVAKRTGELAILVKPWALIWLNGKAFGQTPFREPVAAGRYRLRLSNDDAGKDETTFITINPDQTTTVQRIW